MVPLLCWKSNDALSAQNNLLKHTSQWVLLILAYMYWTLEAERKTVHTHAVMHAHMQPTKIQTKACLIQTITGFSQDLQPHFRYCTLFQVMSFVWNLVEYEKCCRFSTQWIHENKQKPNCWPWCWSFILGDSDCKFLVPCGHPNKLKSFTLGDMNWKTQLWHISDPIFSL